MTRTQRFALRLRHTFCAVAALVSIAVAVSAAPLLQARWELKGQPEFRGVAIATAASGNVIVSTGRVCTTQFLTSCNWFVRAADASAGITLWEDRADGGGFDQSQGVVVHGSRVFASGWLENAAGGADFVVRAYDLHSGIHLWQQRINRFGFSEFAETVGARGSLVFAVGQVRGPAGSNDFTVVALDAESGRLIWENVVDPSGLRMLDAAFALDEQGSRLFVAGPISNFSALLVRAYDAKTGHVLWEDVIAGGTQILLASQVVAHGALVFVAGGLTTETGDQDWLVRAYDQQSGATRWSRAEDAGGHDEVQALYVEGERLFTAGFDACDPFFLSCRFSVRRLDSHSGAVIWHESFQDAPGGDAFSSSLTSAGGRLFAGGAAQNSDGTYQWALRGYDMATGETIADERISGGLTGGFVNALTTTGRRIYAAGVVGSADARQDFVVRAYSLEHE